MDDLTPFEQSVDEAFAHIAPGLIIFYMESKKLIKDENTNSDQVKSAKAILKSLDQINAHLLDIEQEVNWIMDSHLPLHDSTN